MAFYSEIDAPQRLFIGKFLLIYSVVLLGKLICKSKLELFS